MKRNFTLKATINGKEVISIVTGSIRRFLNKARTIKWAETTPRVYLRVSYGEGMFNDGDYKSKEDFNLALNCFLEDSW